MKLILKPNQQILKAICKTNYVYEYMLTIGKIYQIVKEDKVFDSKPYARFIGDDGKEHYAHLDRFEITE
jgi:hypothetical protein